MPRGVSALDEQDRALRVGSSVFDGFKGLQCRRWKIAKYVFGPHLASQAAFYDVQAIWCKHDDPLYFKSCPRHTAGLRVQRRFRVETLPRLLFPARTCSFALTPRELEYASYQW